MKWLFIFLLILNVAYLAWELDLEAKRLSSNVQTLPKTPQSARQLQLLSEIKILPEQRTQTDTETDQIMEPFSSDDLSQQLNLTQMDIMKSLAVKEFGQNKTACFSYGPITDELKVNELYDWLKSNNLKAIKREEFDKTGVMFWIYLAAQEDRQQATVTLKDLEEKGIKDYRLIKRGNFENSISLGLFSSKKRVDARLKELNTMGYDPLVVPYHESGVNRLYWVDVIFDQYSGDFDHILAGVPSDYDSVPVACSDVALAPVNP